MEFHFMGLKNIITVMESKRNWRKAKKWKVFWFDEMNLLSAAAATNSIQFQSSLPNGKIELNELFAALAAPSGLWRVKWNETLQWSAESNGRVGWFLCGGLWAARGHNAPQRERPAQPNSSFLPIYWRNWNKLRKKWNGAAPNQTIHESMKRN